MASDGSIIQVRWHARAAASFNDAADGHCL